MANSKLGSVAIQAGDRAYTLSFSVNALCELEDQLGEPVAKVAAALNDPESVRMSTVRALFWAALRDHHPDTTIPEAGEILSEAGVPQVMEKIGEAFKLAFPEASKKAGPPKAKAQ